MFTVDDTNKELVLSDAISQDEFLDRFERLLPPGYLSGLKSPGPGYELLQALALIGYRISVAVARMKYAQFVTTAVGGRSSTVPVRFYRAVSVGTVVTVKTGTVVRASTSKRDFTVDADVVFEASATTADGTASAVAQSYQWNAAGPLSVVSAVVPGDVDTVLVPIMDPPFGEPGLQVDQLAEGTLGQPPALDLLGEDRGISRYTGEADAAYAYRIRLLPDTVTPEAILRVANQVLASYGVAVSYMIEEWDINLQTCYDAPDAAIPGSDFDPTLFAFDDPRETSFNNVWLSGNTGFTLVVRPIGTTEFSMAFDDPATGPSDLTTPTGVRSASAFDIPDAFTAAAAGAFDGALLVGGESVYKGLWDTIRRIKAGGVPFWIELDPVYDPASLGL